MTTKPAFFYKDKPVFGFDIGHGSLKVMQLEAGRHGPKITGYGTTNFDIHALDQGVIVDPKVIAAATHQLFEHQLIGEITTRRVAMALPGYNIFNRSIQLPKLQDSELREAAQLEVEQYVPVPLQDLYLDFSVTGQTADNYEVLVVAAPKKIVDSYLVLSEVLGLEPILIEPTMAAAARLFAKDKNSDLTSIIMDFGSLTASISIYDKTTLATSTVAAGGLVFTEAIRDKLQVSQEEAGFIKTKYGLGVSMVQKSISQALEPALQKVVTEVRRMMRYYEERYGKEDGISQVVTLGGGANMPGLADYLTDVLKLPVRTLNDPWALFEHDGLKPPMQPDRLMYATVAGLSLLKPAEAFPK